jgi:hypothetical protein
MTRIPVPAPICQRISDKAAQFAREDIASRGWSNQAMGALTAFPGDSKVGIRTSLKYLMRQNDGIKPFIMWWVDKKGGPIPIGCKQGDGPHFRRGGQAGQPGYVDIPHVGRKWRDQKWRHPGLKPKNFMQNAINKAIDQEKEAIRRDIMAALKGEYVG